MTPAPSKAERFRRGSKTFSFAALLFSRQQLEATREFYAFCRIVDDAIDEAPTISVAQRRAEALLEAIDHSGATRTKHFSDDQDGEASIIEALNSWRELELTYQMPRIYARELILGQLMDARGFRPANIRELDLYCYRVAGVVGLAMCHITGILARGPSLTSSHSIGEAVSFEKQTLVKAAACGRALQLTNIARDLYEDHRRGRQYFPANLNPQQSETFDETVAFAQAQQLLLWADESYQLARSGWRDLPLRARFAVAVAQTLYREIGLRLLRLGPQGTRSRSVVPRTRQMFLAFRIVIQVGADELIQSLMRRLRTSQTRDKIGTRGVAPHQTLNFDQTLPSAADSTREFSSEAWANRPSSSASST